MKIIALLLCVAFLSACAKEEVRDSMSQSLKTMCRDNPQNCTLNDPDSARPDGKGAQR